MGNLEHPDITAAHLTGYAASHREPAAVARCAVCGASICEGDDYYDLSDEAVCEGCDRDYMRRFRKIAERDSGWR